MSREDEQVDAAEYVIGTLSGAERAAFEVLLSADKQTRRDVEFWQRIFGALNAGVSPVVPPPHLWGSLEGRISGRSEDQVTELQPATNPDVSGTAGSDDVQQDQSAEEIIRSGETGTSSANIAAAQVASSAETTKKNIAESDEITRLKRSRSRWRWGAIAATIAALALGVMAVNTPLRDRLTAKYLPGTSLAPGKNYIAFVNASADQPSLIVKVNSKTGSVSLRSMGMANPDGKSLELWYVPQGQKAVSVGLVGEGQIDLGTISANAGDLLAISLEPKGGSPTGTATGPVIYTGKLIEDVAAENR